MPRYDPRHEQLSVTLLFLSVLIGVPAAIVSLIELLQADPNQRTQILLFLVILAFFAIWVISVYQGFQNRRTLGRVISIIFSLAAISWFAYDRYQAAVPPEQLLILVARIDGADPEKHQVTNTIIGDLTKALQGHNAIAVRELPQVFDESQGSSAAREAAQRHKATILVWGWYRTAEGPPRLRLHIEILSDSGYRYQPPRIQDFKRTITINERGTITEELTFPQDVVLMSRFIKGIALNLDGKWSEAINSLDDALANAESLGISSPLLLDQISFFRSVSCEYLNIHECALTYASVLDINQSRETAALHNNLGNIYLRIGDYLSAEKHYNQAIEADPEFGTAYANRGLLKTLQRNQPAARSDYLKADQEGTADDALFYLNFAEYYKNELKPEEALDYFRRSIRLHDTAQARYQLGLFFQQQGQAKEARVEFERALELTDIPANKEIIRNALEKLGTP